jgi:hypothetical protein
MFLFLRAHVMILNVGISLNCTSRFLPALFSDLSSTSYCSFHNLIVSRADLRDHAVGRDTMKQKSAWLSHARKFRRPHRNPKENG